MLQWGRDQLIAELSSIPSSADGLCELQWGRDQLIAEFPFAGRPCFVLLHASNGAAIN